MNLAMTLGLYGGGQGSGCQGPNCGRPPSQYGPIKLPRGRMGMTKIDEELRQAGRESKLVLMEYQKDETEKAKTYIVEPYSYREKGAKFFGYDTTAKVIKAFATDKIVRVSIMNKTFKPRWPVELK